MLTKNFTVALTAVLSACCGLAAASTPERVKTNFVKNTGLEPVSVRSTPVRGIWEVFVQERLVYVDDTARYVFSGSLLETETGNNLTQARVREIARDRWKEWPLQDALKQVFGKGERQLVVFSDANCTYCRVMERAYEEVGNLTVYTFIMPMLRGDENAREIVCSKNPARAWRDWMKKGVRPLPVADTCNSDVLGRNLHRARRLGITAAPTLFFPSGDRISGAVTAEQLRNILSGLN